VAERHFVWDLPTRLFHWVLVGLLGFSWWSAENHRLDLHLISGIAVSGLILFRILWGFLGSETSRFAHFLRGPRAVRDYLRGSPTGPAIGHNPLGGWSVILLLLLVAAQVATGLFAVDVDGIESGPLSHLVDFEQGRVAAEWHELSFNLLLVLSAIHVLAILFYLLVLRRNLVRPMITGFIPAVSGSTSAQKAPPWRLVAAVAVAGAFAYGVANGFRL
jgi:cytochrome b